MATMDYSKRSPFTYREASYLGTNFSPASLNKAIIFGTSLEAQCGSGTHNVAIPAGDNSTFCSARGWVDWMNVYLNSRFEIVRNSGVGGNTYTQMRARIETDVLAYDSDWVFMGGPVNDIAGSGTTAGIKADAIYMIERILETGRKILILTAAPSTTYDNATKRQVLSEVNAWIKDLPITYRNVFVADAGRLLADPATGSPATGTVVDGVHFAELGAHLVGKNAALVIDPFTVKKPHRLSSSVDPLSVIANPAFLTNGTGWTLIHGAASGTATYSADEDTFANKAVIDFTGATTNTDHQINFLENISGGRYAVGDIIQASARIRWQDLTQLGIASACRPFLRLQTRHVDSSFTGEVSGPVAASGFNQVIPAGRFPSSGDFVVKTIKLTVPAGTDRIYVAAGWFGGASGKITISDLAVWKNA